jgi:uncharacterized membrane protein
MIPDPLHPALVHFPIVLTFLVPVAAAAALVAIRRGARPRRAWLIPIALSVALTLSAWAAVQTGEAQEGRVERLVPGEAVSTHEDAANRFLLLSLLVAGVMLTGLVGTRVGAVARSAGMAAAALLTIAGYQVGRSGGDLVYRHGAASAYAGGASPTVSARGADRTGPGAEHAPGHREQEGDRRERSE